MTPGRSLYADTAPEAPATGPLQDERAVDFAVVGAGYTGLSAALHAVRQGVSTVVLEAGEVGAGGSGRNHGHCVPVYGYLDPDGAVARLGKARGERWIQLLAGSGAKVFSLIRDHGIDCEAAATGTLHVAHSPAAMAAVERQHARYRRLGREPVLLDRAEAERLTGSPRYHGGWIHPDGGHLNPLAYARGLARAAMAAGAALFTGTPVTAVERQGGRWRVATPGGAVTATTVAICTNAYTGGLLPPLGATYFTIPSYAIASRPLDPALRRTILPANHNVGDTRPDVHFYRFDAANRLVVGGLVERVRGADLARTAAYMTRRLNWIFPGLGPIDWGWHWTGRLAINLDRQPHLYNPAEGLYALLGYSGRGVPTATALGEVLAEAATGRPADELPMAVSPARRIRLAPLLEALVPRLRGPINRLRGALGA